MTGEHGTGRTAGARHQRRLGWTLALTGSFLVVEVAGGLWTGSLALLADAGHMLTDVGAIALSLFAVRFAQRPPNPLHTYGFVRMEILAALANGLVLLVVAGAVLREAWHRLWAPPEIQGGVMLVVALGGLGVNLVAMRLLHEGAGESLNLRGAYLEVLGDALASLAVIAAAVIIQTTGLRVADPIASGLIGLFIVPRTVGLIRQAVHVLMEGVPAHVDVREIERALAAVPGVQAVHDLHVWTLTSGTDAMSAHVVVTDAAPTDEIILALHGLVHERFRIDHATIQVEPAAPRPAGQGQAPPRDVDQICGASICVGAPMADRSARDGGRPLMRVVLLGPPGAGKSTQAARLAAWLRVPRVTSSDLLRAAAEGSSPEAQAIGRAMAAGKLVPSDLVDRLVLARLRQPDCAEGFVLDGYPRTEEQAEALSAAGLSPEHLIEIALDDAEVVTRVTGRRVHEASGRTYHVRFQPPRIEGRDDITGEALRQRADDREEVVRTRLAVYHAQVKALFAHYEAPGATPAPRHVQVDGRGGPEIVFERIQQAFVQSGKRSLADAHPRGLRSQARRPPSTPWRSPRGQ